MLIKQRSNQGRNMKITCLWWVQPAYWSERYAPSTIRRTTEYQALRNVWQAARAYSGDVPETLLTPLEMRALCWERYFLRFYRTESFIRQYGRLDIGERFTWVGTRIGRSTWQTRELLDEVGHVLRDYAELVMYEEQLHMLLDWLRETWEMEKLCIPALEVNRGRPRRSYPLHECRHVG